MTLEVLFTQYKIPLLLIMFLSPWIAYGVCLLVPGKSEEPYVLSANLGISALSSLCFFGYLAYATNAGGWGQVGREADIFLLLSAPYHVFLSLFLSKKRLPLNKIPAYRFITGLMLMGVVYLFLSWISKRIYIIFFARLPFNTFLILLAFVLCVGYIGFMRVFGDDNETLY